MLPFLAIPPHLNVCHALLQIMDFTLESLVLCGYDAMVMPFMMDDCSD